MVMLETMGNGWIPARTTWTYASADDPTYTFIVAGDYTGIYSVGMRIKLTQTTAKYFIITAVNYSSPNTTVTIYGGTDYDLANATITSPQYSPMKAPYGFPMSPAKWTQEKTDTSRRQQSNPTNLTWYNLGTTNSQLSIPIGLWLVSWYACLGTSGMASDGEISVNGTLSNANNTELSKAYSSGWYGRYIKPGAGGGGITVGLQRSFPLEVASKTTFYLNANQYSSAAQTDLSVFGNEQTTVIRAVCAYL